MRTRRLLVEALVNVVDNACREMRHRPPRLEIRLVPAEVTSTIEIIDNGVNEEQSLISDPFEWGTTGHFTTGKGSGYGLPMVRQTFMSLNCWCDLEKTPTGPGCRFLGNSADEKGEHAMNLLAKVRYYVVEDRDESLRDVLQQARLVGLKGEHKIGVARDLDTAIQEISAKWTTIDLIFLDLSIPDDGKDSSLQGKDRGKKLLNLVHNELNGRGGHRISVIIISGEVDDEIDQEMWVNKLPANGHWLRR